jgi:SAM-dependent methyltransferase
VGTALLSGSKRNTRKLADLYGHLLIICDLVLLSSVGVVSRGMPLAPEPTVIKKVATTVYSSFAMLTGMQLDVFTPLKDGPMSAEQIADAIGVKPSRLKQLLFALVAAKLLTMEGELFSNTAETNHFLVRDSPSYIGDHVTLNPLRAPWGTFLKTAESIRTGIPQEKYDESEKSEEELESIYRGWRPVAVRAGHELMKRYDFSSYRTLLDVGGGSGGLAATIVQACPHIQATIVDLPRLTPITQRLVKEARVADRIHVVTADVVREPLSGSFDVAILRAFIQVLWPDDARQALKNVGTVINPGGDIYVLGHILDNSRISPIEEVGYNLACMNYYERVPAEYTEQEYKDWLAEAGFEQIERSKMSNGDGVITAKKPA